MKSFVSGCLFLTVCLFFLSCGPKVEKSQILGKWQGVSLAYPDEAWNYKGGTKLASNIYYEFKDDDTYSGTDLTGAPEFGKFSTLGNMLYLTPSAGSKRGLELKEVSENQLVFNTNPSAIDVLLTLKRK